MALLTVGRPRVAIVSGFDTGKGAYLCHATYVRALEGTGGVPILVPYLEADGDIDSVLGAVHGVVLAGGNDVAPELYGGERDETVQPAVPERDAFEVRLVRMLMARDVPTLAICRGLQVLNVAAGGSLYTDIGNAIPNAGTHLGALDRMAHVVRIVRPSRLAELLGRELAHVNSDHHQAVRDCAPGLRPVAYAADGAIEALESPGHRFLIGVQWHPERIWERDWCSRQLFASFLDACRRGCG